MSDSRSGLSDAALAALARDVGDCWNRIGTSGDRSCPELADAHPLSQLPGLRLRGARLLRSARPRGLPGRVDPVAGQFRQARGPHESGEPPSPDERVVTAVGVS